MLSLNLLNLIDGHGQSRPRMTSLRDKSRDKPFQRSPNLLHEVNAFFSKTDIFNYCHMGSILLPTLSLFPHYGYRDWFEINGEGGVQPADAEKSMLLRWVTIDV